MSVLRVSLGVLLVALAACDGDKPVAPPPHRESVPEETRAPEPPPVAAPQAIVPAPVEAPPTTSGAAPRAAPPTAPAPSAPRTVTPAKVEKAEPLAPLDLTLPDELFERLPGEDTLQEALEPQSLLPPLFGEKAQAPQSFELGGRVITNERSEEDHDWHTVEGAELELRFRR